MKIKIIDDNEEEELDISEWSLDRVFSIDIEWDTVSFMEKCDYYYSVKMNKAEAIKTLNYFIEYINNYPIWNTETK